MWLSRTDSPSRTANDPCRPVAAVSTHSRRFVVGDPPETLRFGPAQQLQRDGHLDLQPRARRRTSPMRRSPPRTLDVQFVQFGRWMCHTAAGAPETTCGAPIRSTSEQPGQRPHGQPRRTPAAPSGHALNRRSVATSGGSKASPIHRRRGQLVGPEQRLGIVLPQELRRTVLQIVLNRGRDHRRPSGTPPASPGAATHTTGRWTRAVRLAAVAPARLRTRPEGPTHPSTRTLRARPPDRGDSPYGHPARLPGHAHLIRP
jgi:hypothetical protein